MYAYLEHAFGACNRFPIAEITEGCTFDAGINCELGLRIL